MLRRIASITLVVVTALLLQSTVFAEVQLFGAKPELCYLVTIAFALLEGPSEGAVVGFASGMAQDFLLDQPKGITALTLTLLGYGVGLLRTYIVSPSPATPTLLVGLGTSVAVAFNRVVAFLLGEVAPGWAFVVRVALLTGLYGALLTPLVFPVLRRVSARSRPPRVVRW
ncbi:MAG TPA: rod shape-determining protein MreD [Actinomycetota bacterium]|nr:rod shape-determining protein MreD [Actinomycetota bacterium]